MKIFAAVDLPADSLEKIRTAAPGHVITARACKTREELAEHLDPETEVLLARFALPLPETVPHLKWIQTFGAGVDHIRSQPIARTDIAFTTASGIHAPGIAELVFGFILHYARSLDKAQRWRAERKWPTPDELFQFFDRPELPGQVLGIVGLGAIGREVARIGAAFGMRVVAVKRHPDRGTGLRYAGADSGIPRESIFGMEDLREAAAQSDYLVIALPLTKDTHHAINADILAAMKPTAVLINVGRGALVDETALIETLKSRKISAAALDVFEREPLPVDSPFYEMDNVFFTQHIAGAVKNYDGMVIDVFATNLKRYLAGEPLLNQVNWELEY